MVGLQRGGACDALFEGLLAGDPLGMVERAREELAGRFLLWDAEGVALRALAVLVHRRLAEGRERCSEALLVAVLGEAIEGLVFGESMGAEARGRVAEAFEVFGLPLGVSGEAAVRACWAHNRAPLGERQAFRGLVIEGRGLDEVAHAMDCDGGRVARGARSVLMKFLQETVTPSGRPDDFGADLRSGPTPLGVHQ